MKRISSLKERAMVSAAGDLMPGMGPARTLSDLGEKLKQTLPEVPRWCVWHPSGGANVERIVGNKNCYSGSFGPWSWKKVPSFFPELTFYNPENCAGPHESSGWTGMIRLTDGSSEFYLVRCFDFVMNRYFFTSETDQTVLDRMEKDLEKHILGGRVRVNPGMYDAYSGFLEEDGREIFLPDGLLSEIENSAYGFFSCRDRYRRLGIPYRRGLLFAGYPGVGKTLVARHLALECAKRFGSSVWFISPDMFGREREHRWSRIRSSVPAVVILEETEKIVSLGTEEKYFILQILDGMIVNEGILFLGTSNEPERIDPSLISRPSRFDRVWRFPLPDQQQREAYIRKYFTQISDTTVNDVIERTDGWSYAYLNELRVTAGILSLHGPGEDTSDHVVMVAVGRLLEQFLEAGKKFILEEKRSIGLGKSADNRKIINNSAGMKTVKVP